ncbi:C40 family peptidase [Pelistega europaea]|uniref:C40 family peptidase n=2 Tax=Pelistega europaea TaxID=106147 RepID=A0A7Y4P562_9BURK|nr:C40 family peptidase [Pelistega europaea]
MQHVNPITTYIYTAMHNRLLSLSAGVCASFRRLLLGGALLGLPLVFATAQAQNSTDPIGSLLQSQGYKPEGLNTTWSPKISDPIGDLINQAKLDRSNLDASISSMSSSPGSELAQAALNYRGVRYRFGGTTPQGFDCSGLIYYTASKHMGVELPRSSASMAKVGTSVSRDKLQPGDLVFFNTRGFRNSHVGIYLGNNEFLHAPRTGKPVRVEKMDDYWNKRYNGARRLPMTQLARK